MNLDLMTHYTVIYFHLNDRAKNVETVTVQQMRGTL